MAKGGILLVAEIGILYLTIYIAGGIRKNAASYLRTRCVRISIFT